MSSASADPLPNDVMALQALLRSVLAERDAALAERDRIGEQNERLRHLLRARFGRRSERLDPDQLELALEDVEQAVAPGEAQAERRQARRAAHGRERPAGRPSLPARGSRW